MIFTIAGKELKSLFASPVAWAVLTAAQFIFAYTFLRRIDDFLQIEPRLARMVNAPGATELIVTPVFATAAAVLLFAVPLLAMRLIAEERRNHTMVLLLSAPISITEIVLGKFLGLAGFLSMVVGLIAVMAVTLCGSTQLDYGLLAALAGGLLLLTGCYTAVGLYASCLTVHPVLAATGAFSALLIMLLLGETAAESLYARGWSVPAALAQVLSPLKNFEPLAKGVVDTYAIACSVLLIVAFIVLSIRRLEAARLRG